MVVETDANVQLRVELMDPAEFTSYLAARQSAVASLNHGISDHASKRHLLNLAAGNERAAAEYLRTLAAVTVQAGAEGPNLTEQRKNRKLLFCPGLNCAQIRSLRVSQGVLS